MSWYAEHKRDLPWRHTSDPYALVVAEIMLQQTGVARVAPAWSSFLGRFPTWNALAEATTAEVIRAWRGLGYNRRALSLLRLAQAVVALGGNLPLAREELLRLPGVGPYTADAILSFVHGADAPTVDVNLRRVVGRVVLGDGAATVEDVRAAAIAALPTGRSREWNQATMDFAALTCTLTRPACDGCVFSDVCLFRVAGGIGARRVAERGVAFTTTTRYLRGRLVDACRALGVTDLLRLDDARAMANGHDVEAVLGGLVRDGLLARHEDGHGLGFSLP